VNERPSQRPTLFQVAVADVRTYQFFGSTLLFLCFGVLLLFSTSYATVGIAVLLLGLVFGGALAWRVYRFHILLARGVPIPGMLVAIRRPMFASKGRYRFRFDCTYTYTEQEYRHRARVSLLAQRVAFEAGDTVTVLLDPDRPRRAMIPDLYCTEYDPRQRT
jgi:hypothetical protein